jgi:hypothetical protein
VDREPETEIVSDAHVRLTRRAAKKATGACADKSAVTVFEADLESVEPAVVVATAGEPTVGSLPDEKIRELEVVRIPLNPRLVLASLDEGGPKQVVRVWVGVNRNFRPRMRLRAKRGSGENALWRLIGKRPRLPGRW